MGSTIDAEGWITAAAPTAWTGAAAADWTAEGNWSRGVPSTALPARIDLPDATPVVPADTTAPTAGTIDLGAKLFPDWLVHGIGLSEVIRPLESG